MERIAVILGKMNKGGVESVVLDYYKNIDHSRYQFDFYVDKNSTSIDYSGITELGGRIFLIPPIKKYFNFKKVLKFYLKQGKYNIIHAHLNTLSFLVLKIAKKLGVTIRINHNHTTSNAKEIVKHIIKILLKPFANLYVTDRCACGEHAGKWLFGNKEFDRGNVKIINNAIDCDRFKFNQCAREELRNEWGMQDNYVIGNIGRFVPQKNQKFLLKVFNDCLKINPSARLVLVGEGRLKHKLIKKAKKYKIYDKIRFVLPRDDVEKLYSAFDCLAFPSIYEGLGRVVIEAQACGLGCVCSTDTPREVKLTSLVKFVKRTHYRTWIDSILKCTCDREHDFSLDFISRGYNIQKESLKLIEWYDELFEKHGANKNLLTERKSAN